MRFALPCLFACCLFVGCEQGNRTATKIQLRKAVEFMDGIPVIRSCAEAQYHSGTRVAVVGKAVTDGKVGATIELDRGLVDIPKESEWSRDLEGRTVRAIGVVKYAKYDDSEGSLNSGPSETIDFDLESIELDKPQK
jgi:hypothetical protein